jgi:hypothetical protein
MKLSIFKSYLAGELSSSAFCTTIRKESIEFRRNSDVVGSSMPIYAVDDISELEISTQDILAICNLYFDDQIDEIELEYLCNVLELSESITYDASIEHFLFQLSTPEINQKLSKNYVRELLKTILNKP